MRSRLISKFLILILTGLIVSAAFGSDNTRHVSARTPVQGNSREFAAERSGPSASTAFVPVPRVPHNWKKLATLPGAVIHDISFATPKVGYIAAEAGQVWKTTNGGSTWSKVLNLSFPYYFYGVKALTATDVVVSGFNDSNFEGIIRWSHDGGSSWTSDIVLTTSGWCDRVRFTDSQHGLVLDQLNLNAPNAAHYTTDGGSGASDWTADVPDPNGGWFGNQFSILSNQHVRTSGITYCASPDGGATWTCGPPVDSVFDGPVFFASDKAGWVGGGEISPNVEGWVHRTTDGGKTWSGRTLDIGWPIREIFFFTPNIGWAAGGNIYSGVGGMYFSNDGGQTWSEDVNTGAEMGSCDGGQIGTKGQIWCAGSDASLNGVVYTLQGRLP